MPSVFCALAAALIAVVSTFAPAFSQSAPADSTELLSPDSTGMYRLGSVTVTDRAIEGAEPVDRDVVRMAEVNRTDATSVAELIHEIPSARVQTNSRGEAILYIRNAGERQAGIFMDGALLNVPWDNRIDLSLVPMNAVGGLTVEQGTPSVLYGANVMGGAVNISTRELSAPGYLTEVRAGAGELGYLDLSATHMGRTEHFNYIGALSFNRRDGYAVPSGADLPYSQSDPGLRTNTDVRIAGLYVRGEYRLHETGAIGLSVNVVDAEKGVAPESHIDPDVDRVRYWRYPEWRNINITGTYDFRFGAYELWNIRGALWTTLFSQRIEQYESDAYTTIGAAERDNDYTVGTRSVLSREFDNGMLSIALNELYSTHLQVDSEFDALGTELPEPDQRYAQHTFSTGAEYKISVSDAVRGVLGASLDGMVTVDAGNKPRQDPYLAPGITAAAAYSLSDNSALRLSVARKSRFPSMRELYGEALRRFLVNTELRPESSWNGELGYIGTYRKGRIELNAFTGLTSNTIDQRRVDTLGNTKRQRINLPGSRVFGLELSGTLTGFRPLRVTGHLMLSHARGVVESENDSDSLVFLTEKPEALGTLNAGYDFDFGLILDAEAIYTGNAYGPDGNGGRTELGASLSVNVRAAYRWIHPFNGLQMLELFVRADNVSDAVVFPQEGLPSPGREVRGGIRLAL